MEDSVVDPSPSQTCGTAHCTHLALTCEACNAAFLTLRSITMPTMLCVICRYFQFHQYRHFVTTIPIPYFFVPTHIRAACE